MVSIFRGLLCVCARREEGDKNCDQFLERLMSAYKRIEVEGSTVAKVEKVKVIELGLNTVITFGSKFHHIGACFEQKNVEGRQITTIMHCSIHINAFFISNDDTM